MRHNRGETGIMKWRYLIVYYILKPLCAVFYPMRFTGRDNIPDGPAILCANHSNFIDPVLLALACGKKHWLHFMAKAELMEIPILGRIFKGIGAFGVQRGKSDITAIRTAMKYLKSGEKIMMFPEGTRVSADEGTAAKTGAIRLASKLNVPLIPAYIPRRKRIFRRVRIAIGQPYFAEASGRDDFDVQSNRLMQKIYELRTD